MKTKLKRKTLTDKTTIGDFSINGKDQCLMLEDKTRDNNEEHVKGSTSIPYGIYQVVLRQDGTIWKDLCNRFKDIGQERGILHIYNIDGNEYDNWYDSPGVKKNAFVLIHPGNTEVDTLGCLLPGTTAGKDIVNESVKAYKKIYPIIADALTQGEEVTIEITN